MSLHITNLPTVDEAIAFCEMYAQIADCETDRCAAVLRAEVLRLRGQRDQWKAVADDLAFTMDVMLPGHRALVEFRQLKAGTPWVVNDALLETYEVARKAKGDG